MNTVKDLEEMMKFTAFQAEVEEHFPALDRLLTIYRVVNNIQSKVLCLMLVLATGKILIEECRNRKEILEVIKRSLDEMMED